MNALLSEVVVRCQLIGAGLLCVALAGCASRDAAVVGEEAARPAAAPQAAPPPRPPAGPVGILGGEVVAPRVGQSVTRASGCMERESVAEEPVTRSAAPNEEEAVRVSVYGTGVLVTHVLPHNCCQRGDVVAQVDAEGGAVRVVQRLGGPLCRCMCGSEVKTRVGLSPGAYAVSVWVEQEGSAARLVHEEQVVIEVTQEK